MATLQSTDEPQVIALTNGTASTMASKYRSQPPRLQVKVSTSAQVLPTSSIEPFWLKVSLQNLEDYPVTISKTSRIIDLPAALHKRCIAFRDPTSGQVVHYGSDDMGVVHEPYSQSGIPKRWKPVAEDLVTIPPQGIYTIKFDLNEDNGDIWRRESWLEGFHVGRPYEVAFAEDLSIMYWTFETIDDVTTSQDLLGHEWPQQHLQLEVVCEPKVTFTVLGDGGLPQSLSANGSTNLQARLTCG